MGKPPLTPKILDFFIFGSVLGGIGGILDMVGTILADYQPKRRCMTLEQPKVLDFCLKSGILSNPMMPV